jgi:predicted RNase H-like nuclease
MYSMRVVGVDGCKEGWVAVVLQEGRTLEAGYFQTIEQVIAAHSSAAAIGVDIPIGYPVRGSRQADLQARHRLGTVRGRSVFDTCPPWAIAQDSYEATQREAERRRARGEAVACPSKQSWALKRKMLEVERIARTNVLVYEVHPELSFWAMRQQKPILESKRTWAGFWIRLRLLEEQGIRIPDDIDNGELCGIDDVLDAAAVAWSAHRIATRTAGFFPPRGEEQFDEHGRAVAIWY